MEEKDFVAPDESLALKQLGFNEPCYGVYVEGTDKFLNINAEPRNWNDNLVNGDVTSAPLYQQAFRWFAKTTVYVEWPIESWIQPYLTKEPRTYEGRYWQRGEYNSVGVYNSHPEAQLEVLRKLIEVVREQQKNS